MSSAPSSLALTPPRGGRLAFAALLLGAAAIGFAPIFVRLSEIGPTATAFQRLLLALPALWLWALWDSEGRAAGPAGRRDWLALAACGLFFAGDLAVWHWSITFTAVANATLITNLAPIFVTFGAWALFRERFTRTFLAGLVLGITGVFLLMGDSVELGVRNVTGDALGLLAAVFYGAYLLTVSRLRRRFSTAVLMAWSGTFTCLGLLPVALLSGESLLPATAHGWGILVALALLSHVGGQGLIAYALAHLPAAFSSLSLLLQPVIAAGLAWLLLAEALRPVQALGAVVVLAGILLARRGSR